MISKIRHTGIVVRNLDQAVKFYETLGFETMNRQVEKGKFLETVVGLENASVETAKLESPCGSVLELLQYKSHPVKKDIKPQSSNQLGCSHIAMTVYSINQALDSVKRNGGSLVNLPSISPNG